MPVVFPPVESATEDGLVALGGKLDFETLEAAYLNGIFPWPIEGVQEIPWFSLDPRGIISVSEFRLPKSFRRFINNHFFVCTFNQQFEDVINRCGDTPRVDQTGTWINDEIIAGYTNLFKRQKAYSVEIYDSDKKLVGGLYGTCFGEIVTAESMFHTESNASKYALFCLIEKLKQWEIPFLDTQMITPTVETFGGKQISRSDYIKMLKELDSNRNLRW